MLRNGLSGFKQMDVLQCVDMVHHSPYGISQPEEGYGKTAREGHGAYETGLTITMRYWSIRLK